ncbi:hypothetical protein NHX12_009392, partial [Muraenolepis orangiensis]
MEFGDLHGPLSLVTDPFSPATEAVVPPYVHTSVQLRLTTRDARPMRGVMRVTWSWATPLLITMVLLRLAQCEESPVVP